MIPVTQSRTLAGTMAGRLLAYATRPPGSLTSRIGVRNAFSTAATDPDAGSRRRSPVAGPAVRPYRRNQDRSSETASGDDPKRAWTCRGRRKWRNRGEDGAETCWASLAMPPASRDRSTRVTCSRTDRVSAPSTRVPAGSAGAAAAGT